MMDWIDAVGMIAGWLLAMFLVALLWGWVHSILWMDPDKETA